MIDVSEVRLSVGDHEGRPQFGRRPVLARSMEAIIYSLEDAGDYGAFETALSDYDARTAVEGELVA
jgi:hypothetical protein